MNTQLGVVCPNRVDFYRPGYICIHHEQLKFGETKVLANRHMI